MAFVAIRTYKKKKTWSYISNVDFPIFYNLGKQFIKRESPVEQQPIFCQSAAVLRQKMWKQGLPFSTTGSVESGMKEMNAPANHSSQFTGSFSKPLLAFQLFGGGEEGWLADMHMAL